jgi:hypothetical protein
MLCSAVNTLLLTSQAPPRCLDSHHEQSAHDKTFDSDSLLTYYYSPLVVACCLVT